MDLNSVQLKELRDSEVPDYSTAATRKAQNQVSPYRFIRSHNFPCLIKRGPVQEANRTIYTGEWNQKGQKEGLGTQVWLDGSKYEGNWMANMAHGEGRLIHANGDIYEGNWDSDKADGFGVYIHADGTVYRGQWIDDKQTGEGTETWACLLYTSPSPRDS